MKKVFMQAMRCGAFVSTLMLMGDVSLNHSCFDEVSADRLSYDTVFPLSFRGDLSPANAAYTIYRPGVYKLTSAKTASGVPNISITANNVTLDLGGNVLTGGTDGIQVTGNNVTVKNGSISGMTQNGVLVQGNECRLEGLDVTQCATGITLESCNQGVVDKCSVRNVTYAGVSLQSTWTSSIEGCTVSGVERFGDVYGFVAENGGNNTFNVCTVSDVRTTYTSTLIVDIPGWITAKSGGIILRNEQESSIVGSQAQSISAYAQAKNATYGIGTLPGDVLTYADTLLSITQSSYAEGVVSSVAWLTLGNDVYLVSGSYSEHLKNHLTIYKFDAAMSSLLSVTQKTFSSYGEVSSVAWLVVNNNIYIAAGGRDTNEVKIFKFDRELSSLLLVAQSSYAEGDVFSVDWLVKGDNIYLASGGGPSLTDFNQLKIYKFDVATNSLLSVTQSKYPDAPVYSVAWLQEGDNSFLATGETTSSGSSGRVKIYRFDATTSNLFPVVSSSNIGGPENSVSWLTQGSSVYLASGGETVSGVENEVKIYKFDIATSSLVSVTHSSYPEGSVYSIAWLLQDGIPYLASGGFGTNTVKIFRFDAATSSLLSVTQSSYAEGLVRSVDWLVQGGNTYLASGGYPVYDTGNQVKIYQLDGFSQQQSEHCCLSNNSIQAIHNNQQSLAAVGGVPVGTGLYLSTTDNFVVQNTAYDCDISFAGVPTHYITSQADARGVYNIDINLTTPDKLEDMHSNQLPTIENQVDNLPASFFALESVVDTQIAVMPCLPVRSPGTLVTPGSYCLADTINGALAITGTGITLCMNEHTLNGGQLLISGDYVTVSDGTVRNNASASGVRLTGNNCFLNNLRSINNRTGFELSSADKNTLTNCSALGCTREGFLLESSERNYVADCEVQSLVGTGTIAGFKTTIGTSNKFMNCSVNGVSTTNGDAYGVWGNTEHKSLFSGTSINEVSTSAGSATGFALEQDCWLSSELAYSFTCSASADHLVLNVDWLRISPGRIYLATADNNFKKLLIYRFDGVRFDLCYEYPISSIYRVVRWLRKDDKNYLVACWSGALGYDTQVFLFDEVSETLLTLPNAGYTFDTENVKRPDFASWLPCEDGRIFLALAGDGDDNDNLQILSFDGNSLTLVTKAAISGRPSGVDWCTTGSRYLLAAGSGSNTATILEFDPQNNTLTTKKTISGLENQQDVRWLAYDGLAYLGVSGGSTMQYSIYSYNLATDQLLTRTSISGLGTNSNSNDWLVTGTTIYAAFATQLDSCEITIYRFNPTANSLTPFYIGVYAQASSCRWLQWLTGVQGRAVLAVGLAKTGAGDLLSLLGFDLVGSTTSLVLDTTVSNIDGTGIAVNELSDSIFNSKVYNATTPYYPWQPLQFDPSNKVLPS